MEKWEFFLFESIIGFCVLLLLILFLIVVWNFFLRKKGSLKHIKMFIRILCIFSLFNGLFCCIIDFFHILYGYLWNVTLHDDRFYVIRPLSDIFMFTSLLSLYSLIVGRLVITFKTTKYVFCRNNILYFYVYIWMCL